MYMLRNAFDAVHFFVITVLVELDSFDDAFFFEPNIFLRTHLLLWFFHCNGSSIIGRCNLAQRAS